VPGNRSELLQRVAITARVVPPPILERFCDELERLPVDVSRDQIGAVLRTVPQQHARDVLTELLAYWRRELLELQPDQLAWALRAAGETDKRWDRWQSVELVWTGPDRPHSSLRRTEQALLDVIESARHSLLIVTFAAYRIPQVGGALLAAAERDVQIRFIAESPETSEGKVSFAGFQALGEPLRRHAQLYIWPKEKREVDAAGHFGALHAKCAVADEHTAFISSANLTDHALNLNVELGVLIRGGEVPAKVARHFRDLIGTNVLAPVHA